MVPSISPYIDTTYLSADSAKQKTDRALLTTNQIPPHL